MENNDKLKEIDIKNCTCYHFDEITKSEDFDLDNVLVNEKSYKNILVYNILYKTLISDKPLHIKFDKIDGFMMEVDICYYLEVKNMISFTAGLNSL